MKGPSITVLLIVLLIPLVTLCEVQGQEGGDMTWLGGIIGVVMLCVGMSIIVYIRTLHAEINQRRTTQQKLEESEEQIRLLVENMENYEENFNSYMGIEE